MTIHKNVTELIGRTPLVELTNYENRPRAARHAHREGGVVQSHRFR